MARILVVDGDPLFLAIMSRALEKAHHDVVAVTDGAKATELFLSDPFDGLVCDLAQPPAAGLQLIREARQHAPQAAIVATSATKSQGREVHTDVLKMANAVGANAVVKKPFEVFDFVATVETALGLSPKRYTASKG